MVALVAHQNDEVLEPGGAGEAVFAGGVKAAFKDVSRNHERVGDHAVGGDLRVGADVDQRRAGADRLEGGERVEPVQVATRSVEELIDRLFAPS